MNNRQDLFETMPLFQGIRAEDRERMLQCLGGRRRCFRKGEMVLAEDDPPKKMGILLKGSLQVIKEDVFGNRNIVEILAPGDLFGAAFACAGVQRSPVSVMAGEAAELFLMDIRHVLEMCPTSCPFHSRLLQNMIALLARKNVSLNEKIEHLSRRSTREKLLSYLSETAKKEGKRHFFIPFNRQELADYLCVERSAMSAELSKLRGEGLLDYKRSEFWLI